MLALFWPATINNPVLRCQRVGTVTERDEFLAKTVRTLAYRVGHRCSNPACGRPTIGPGKDENSSVNIGVAAHITAAAVGGPRYDASLTSAARRNTENGIWLCQTCAKLIDSDVPRYPADSLRKWKSDATQRAFVDIATASFSPSNRPAALPLDDADQEFLNSLALQPEDSVDATLTRMLAAAATDLASFRSAKGWPTHTLSLHLSAPTDQGARGIDLAGFAEAISVSSGISLVSDPGTGKTTTMVQVAEAVVASKRAVAAVVPLGEWSDSREDFLAFLCHRAAFAPFRWQHFGQLAFHGRLILLLDGWNELDPGSRLRATRALTALQRDYPLLGVVSSTRRHRLPLLGQVVEIESLSPNQQLELARALRGNDGQAIVDRAWRTPGVRELIAIPLYLTALLTSVKGTEFPSTREEILRLFVSEHERMPERVELFDKELSGLHSDMLISLAVEANRIANTSISDSDARRVIADTEDHLVQTGQLRSPPRPNEVLDVLVSAHTLVRSTMSAGGISFQHQQFQEWYASAHVERLMRQAAAGDVASCNTLRVDILNWPSWEESILFACERLSRADGAGTRAVASCITDALSIDPLFAAEMIYRSADAVWSLVKAPTIAFAQRWHKTGRVDRAVRFMIATGRAEFADTVRALVASPDNQVYLRTLRAAPRFRSSVLGSDPQKFLARLTDGTRGHVVAELVHNGAFEELELATILAKNERNAHIVLEILKALHFRGAEQRVIDVLRAASDEVWQLVAREHYPETIAEDSLNIRLRELRVAQASGESNPIRALSMLSRYGVPDATERIQRLLESQDFPIRSDNARAVLEDVQKRYPQETAAAFLTRIERGLDLPFGIEEILELVPPVESGHLVTLARDVNTPEPTARAALALLGPQVVGRMLDELLALDDRLDRVGREGYESERKEYSRIQEALSKTRDRSFFAALLERAGATHPSRIRLLADLLSRRGGLGETDVLTLDAETRAALVPMLQRWIDSMLRSPEANRHQFSYVVRAAGCLGDASFVNGLKAMLERDLTDHARAREERMRATHPGPLTPDVTHSYAIQYQRTLAAIGGREVTQLMIEYLPDLRFGVTAAGVLLDVWQRGQASQGNNSLAPWRDYSVVKTRRSQRQNARCSSPSCDSAESIFTVVRELGVPDRDEMSQLQAIALARIGLGLPHGSKRADVDALLALPVAYAVKQGLLTAAALAGERLPADVLLAGLRELLEAASRESWRLDDNRGELSGWLELFPFSDRPTALLEALALVPQSRRHPFMLRGVLMALANSPEPDGVEVLVTLARQDPQLADQFEWMNAIMSVGTEDAARGLLNLVAEGTLVAHGRGPDAHHLSHNLARVGEAFPRIRSEMLGLYRTLPRGPARTIVESALAEVADEEIIFSLIDGFVLDGRPIDSRLYKAIRDVAIGRRPSQSFQGAYEEFGIPLTDLRKRLFDMYAASGRATAIAVDSLTEIDALRDKHGRLNDEPRHPNIESSLPWPPEGGAA